MLGFPVACLNKPGVIKLNFASYATKFSDKDLSNICHIFEIFYTSDNLSKTSGLCQEDQEAN